MEKSRQTAAIGVPPGVSLTPSRTTRSLGWCNDGCASCGLRQGGPGLSSVNVDGSMDMDHRRRDPDGTPREGKPGLVGSERSHWDLLRCCPGVCSVLASIVGSRVGHQGRFRCWTI